MRKMSFLDIMYKDMYFFGGEGVELVWRISLGNVFFFRGVGVLMWRISGGGMCVTFIMSSPTA